MVESARCQLGVSSALVAVVALLLLLQHNAEPAVGTCSSLEQQPGNTVASSVGAGCGVTAGSTDKHFV